MDNFQMKLPYWVGWMGDMNTPNKFLYMKSWRSPWAVLKFINAMIRSIGVVAFANNPITGILILVATFLEDVNIGLACIMCLTIALIVSKITGATNMEMRDGLCAFNCVLLGCVVTSVTPGILKKDLDASYWIMLAVASVITCYVDQGMNAMMAPSKLPAQSLAFNIVGALLVLVLQSYQQVAENVETNQVDQLKASRNYSLVDWGEVMKGTVLSSGQIYGLGTMVPSALVWLGFLLYSPLLVVCFYVGSVIGTIGAVVATNAPLSEIYLGLWGYNSMLTTGGLSFFLLPSLPYFGAIVIGAVMALAAQVACTLIFAVNAVPVFSFPFNIVIAIIIAMSTRQDPQLVFVKDRTFHELHIYRHYVLKKRERFGVSNIREDEINKLC